MSMVPDRILIVEDDSDTRFILERSLAKNSFEVQTAANGLEALRKLDNFNPHVILADWTMPQMDGIQLCNIVKQDEKYKLMYFILLTARSSLKDRVMGLDVGADDFLVKPVENQELFARIRSGIRIYKLQSELREIEHSKAIVELACALGHQINNPLTSLVATIKNIQMDLPDLQQEKHKEDFDILDQAIDRIKKSVDALQNISDPEIVKYIDGKLMVKIV